MEQRRRIYYSAAERAEIWDRRRASRGQGVSSLQHPSETTSTAQSVTLIAV